MKKDKKLEGIKGWLLVATISLALSILGLIVFSVLFSIDLIIFGKDYLTISFLSSSVIGAILGVYALIAEILKKRIFIKLVIIFISYGILIDIVFSIILREFSGLGIIVSTFWILYFIDSKRVKNTFVN